MPEKEVPVLNVHQIGFQVLLILGTEEQCFRWCVQSWYWIGWNSHACLIFYTTHVTLNEGWFWLVPLIGKCCIQVTWKIWSLDLLTQIIRWTFPCSCCILLNTSRVKGRMNMEYSSGKITTYGRMCAHFVIDVCAGCWLLAAGCWLRVYTWCYRWCWQHLCIIGRIHRQYKLQLPLYVHPFTSSGEMPYWLRVWFYCIQ